MFFIVVFRSLFLFSFNKTFLLGSFFLSANIFLFCFYYFILIFLINFLSVLVFVKIWIIDNSKGVIGFKCSRTSYLFCHCFLPHCMQCHMAAGSCFGLSGPLMWVADEFYSALTLIIGETPSISTVSPLISLSTTFLACFVNSTLSGYFCRKSLPNLLLFKSILFSSDIFSLFSLLSKRSDIKLFK